MNEDRRDDWRSSVDEHLMALTTAQKVTDKQLEDIEQVLTRWDRILRGDPQEDLIGLTEQIRNLELDIRKINAVLFMDSTGKRGIAHDIDVLMDRKKARTEGSQYRWQFWTTFVAALIAALTAILTNWDKIRKSLPNPIQIEEGFLKSRKPKPIRKVRRRALTPPSSLTGESPENPPQ